MAGYMISDVCLDKDGIRAAAAFGELASSLYAKGQTLQQHLESLYTKYVHGVACARARSC